MKKRGNDQFTGKMFRRLWMPAMASSLALAIADMADAIVVGQRMGATGLAAISIALPVYMVINVFMHGFGIGGSVRYSKLLGEGKEEEAVGCFNQIVLLILLGSIALSVLGNLFLEPFLGVLGVRADDGMVFFASRDYVRVILCGMPALFLSFILNYFLRNDNNQKLASIGFAIGSLSDFGLNVLFVLVLDFGAYGAALSTVLGQVICILIYLPGLSGKKHILRLGPAKMEWKMLLACFRTGFSTSVQYVWQMLFLLIVNHTLMYYSGENGVAVFDMVQNVSYLILYLYDGTAKAMQPLASTYQGEHNRQGSRSIRRMGILYGSAVGFASSVLLSLFPQGMCMVFGLAEGDVMGLASTAIRIYCLGGVFGGISILLEGYCQACGQEGMAFLLATLRGAAVLIPCTILFAPLGLGRFWFLFPATEIGSLLLFGILKKTCRARETFDMARVYSRTIEGRNENLGKVIEEIGAFCETWEADGRQQYYVAMTVEEICILIIRKAFGTQEEVSIQITLVALPDAEFELHIRDNARIFDPFSMETNKVNEGEDYDMDAMGVLVIKEKAKHFFYRQYQGFNSLIVRI